MRNNLEILVRKKYGLSDEDELPSQVIIARDAKVSQNTVSRWLMQRAGRFDEDVLAAFCEFFDCEVGDLIQYIRNKPRASEPEKELA